VSKSGVNQCMARLDVAYPHHFKQADLDADFALQVYHEILDDVDDGLLMAATKQWLSTAHPFHPSPGELRDLALRMVERDELSADEAWAEVLAAVRNIGSYGVPAWSNDAITQTMQAFGRWKEFCATEDDQMPFVRAQFMNIYKAQQTRRHDDRLMLPEVQTVMAQLAESKRLQLRSGE
jgi:hypothetical protein